MAKIQVLSVKLPTQERSSYKHEYFQISSTDKTIPPLLQKGIKSYF